ncbi:MAG: hypothetical protein GY897_20190 [Alteromonas sp.]|nr:hypothetical protein [Alteromonas sp.]
MNNELDDKIKQALQDQAKELDTLVDGGLSDYLGQGFKGGFSSVMKLGYALAFALTGLIIFLGFRFFTAVAETELFWGVLLVLAFNAQIAVKLWIFMQTNRNIVSRELRLLELRLSKESRD